MMPSTGAVRRNRARAAALPVAIVLLLLVALGALAGAWGGSGAGVPMPTSVSAAGQGSALTGLVTSRAQVVRPITRNGAGGTSSDERRFAAPSGVAGQSVSTLAALAAPDRAAAGGTVSGGSDPGMLPCRPRAPGLAVLAVPRSVTIPAWLSGGTGLACSTRAPPGGVLVLAP